MFGMYIFALNCFAGKTLFGASFTHFAIVVIPFIVSIVDILWLLGI